MAASFLGALASMKGAAGQGVQNTAGLSGAAQSPVDASSDPLQQLSQMRASPQVQQQVQNYGTTLNGAGLLGGATSGQGQVSAVAGPQSGRQSALIKSADSFLGTPYVYGGVGHGGIDCSGLTDEAYAGIGLNIGRDTSAQFSSPLGHAVGQDGNWASAANQLQPGDLIFYGQPGASGPNAHVVMYIGNGQVIQAAHTGTDVATSPLFSAASSDEPFLGVRRYL